MPDWARISSSLISDARGQIVVLDEDPLDPGVEGVGVGQVQEQEARAASARIATTATMPNGHDAVPGGPRLRSGGRSLRHSLSFAPVHSGPKIETTFRSSQPRTADAARRFLRPRRRCRRRRRAARSRRTAVAGDCPAWPCSRRSTRPAAGAAVATRASVDGEEDARVHAAQTWAEARRYSISVAAAIAIYRAPILLARRGRPHRPSITATLLRKDPSHEDHRHARFSSPHSRSRAHLARTGPTRRRPRAFLPGSSPSA